MEFFYFLLLSLALFNKLWSISCAEATSTATFTGIEESSGEIKMEVDSTNVEYVHMESMMTRNSITKRIDFKPHSETVHELTFAIKQNNADKMHDLLMERSMPGQPLYQQWMSNDEVRALTRNSEASEALLAWFSEHGILVEWVNRGQEYFRVRTHIGKWERLLRTTFHEFHEHTHDKTITAVRAESYSLPASIAVHVSAVFGAVDFPVQRVKFGVQTAKPNEKESIFDEPVSFTKDRFGDIRTEATVSNDWIQWSIYASNTCTGFSSPILNFRLNYCVPFSPISGVNSVIFNATNSTGFLNAFSDTACKAPLGINQQIPSGCFLFGGLNSKFVLSFGSFPPPPINGFNDINYVV